MLDNFLKRFLACHRSRARWILCSAILVAGESQSVDQINAQEIPVPQVLIDGWKMELFDSEPRIVTPTACDVDANDNLFVVECHTHFPPDDYSGPKVDRIWVYIDKDKDGNFEQRELFYEGGVATMSIACDAEGWVYASSRSQIIRLKDNDGDFKADVNEQIIDHDTDANYPHNGLSSLLLFGEDEMIFGQGENFGEPYKLIGTDGSVQQGQGEGGNLYRCKRDGSKLTRYATGFWNPFGLSSDASGQLFVVDNDPDATPPNRLLKVIHGGDYGFQFRFGRAGTHPLLAWNGEYPGTKGMAAGVGEAACAVTQINDRLWVTSWGDNRIEEVKLDSRDSGGSGVTRTIIQGDAMFRPVDFARTSKNVLYVTDWVDRSYSVHQKGRIWKLTPSSANSIQPEAGAKIVDSDIAIDSSSTAKLLQKDSPLTLRELQQLHWLQLTTQQLSSESIGKLLKGAIDSKSYDVRLYAIRWAAETSDQSFVPLLEVGLSATELERAQEFSALVAAISYIKTGSASGSRTDPAQDGMLAEIVLDAKRDMKLRILAAKKLSREYAFANVAEAYTNVSESKDELLSHEFIAWLGAKANDEAIALLKGLVQDSEQPSGLRADALAALAANAPPQATLQMNKVDTRDVNRDLNLEFARIKKAIERASADSDAAKAHVASLPKTDDLAGWLKQVGSGGDPAAGWRVWTRSQCVKCHAFNGRGATVGPELTGIASGSTREKILQSILQPSREVAPLYVTWQVLTTDGKIVVGPKVNGGGVGESARYLQADGTTVDIAMEDIEEQKEIATSVMPENLVHMMDLDELRDLLAFFDANRS